VYHFTCDTSLLTSYVSFLAICITSFFACSVFGVCIFFFFFFNDTATTEIYTLSLHDALPICRCSRDLAARPQHLRQHAHVALDRSEEHTSELQSRRDLVCRLLLEKKKVGGQVWHSHHQLIFRGYDNSHGLCLTHNTALLL